MRQAIRNFSLFFLVFLGTGLNASAQALEKYLREAAENNPEVKAAYAQFEASLQQSPQVSSLPDPTLTVGAFGRMMQSDMGAEEAKLSLMQMFPWFGTLGAMEDAANLMAEARFQEYLDVRDQVFLKVKTAYAELFLVSRTVELQRENLDILNSYKELALSGLRSGNSPMVNVVKIDLELDAAATELEILQESLVPLKVNFNLLRNRSGEEEVVIPDSLTITPMEEFVMEDSLIRHPKIQMLQREKEGYQKQQEVARKQGMPQLGIGLDYTINSKTPTGMHGMNGQDAYMPMLSVSLPIFRKKYKAARKEAEFLEEAAGHQQAFELNELTSSYVMTKYEWNTALKLLDLYERQVRSSEQANELLISAFSNSRGSFEEVLDMNQTILLLKMQQLEAQAKAFSAQARMEYLISNTTGNEPEQ